MVKKTYHELKVTGSIGILATTVGGIKSTGADSEYAKFRILEFVEDMGEQQWYCTSWSVVDSIILHCMVREIIRSNKFGFRFGHICRAFGFDALYIVLLNLIYSSQNLWP